MHQDEEVFLLFSGSHDWFNTFNHPTLRGSKTGKHSPLELRHGNRRWDFFFGGFAP